MAPSDRPDPAADRDASRSDAPAGTGGRSAEEAGARAGDATTEHPDASSARRAARDEARRSSREAARARRTVGGLRGVAAATALLAAAALVFTLKLWIAVTGGGLLGLLLLVQLVGNVASLGACVGAFLLAPSRTRTAAGLVAGVETLVAATFLPMFPLARISFALVLVVTLRALLVVATWSLFARAGAAERALAARTPRDEGSAHRAADLRAARSRRTRARGALRLAAIAAPLAGLVWIGAWFTSPARDFDRAAEEFASAWNGDVASVRTLLTSAEARGEWETLVEQMGWRRRRPVLTGAWTVEHMADGSARSLHPTSLGSDVEARWVHDGTWRLVSASPELGLFAARFRVLWNGRELEALPWFFSRPDVATSVLQYLFEQRGWYANPPELGEPIDDSAKPEKRSLLFPLGEDVLDTDWRFRGGRWRITGFVPPQS